MKQLDLKVLKTVVEDFMTINGDVQDVIGYYGRLQEQLDILNQLLEMTIASSVVENTGGGVNVTYLSIENGGNLQMIGISDDCIVGYNKPYIEATGDEDTLWYVGIRDWSNLKTVQDDLNRLVPSLANELLIILIRTYGYPMLEDYSGEELFTCHHFQNDNEWSTAISNPFYDETGRFEVDPITEYGLDNIVEAISKL